MKKRDCYHKLNQRIFFEIIIAIIIAMIIFTMLDFVGADLLNRYYKSDEEKINAEINEVLLNYNNLQEENIEVENQYVLSLLNKVKSYKYQRMMAVLLSVIVGCVFFLISNKNELEKLQKQVTYAQYKEAQAVNLKNTLIRDMSHDLHTPLTGLKAYAEIVKNQNENSNTKIYIEKILQKADQIHDISNRLFDLALSSDEIMHLEKPLYIEDAIGDYLSEIYGSLVEQNFKVDVDKLRWEMVKVSVDSNFISRIMENIISNILSYANSQKMIYIESKYDNNCVGIIFSNYFNKTIKEVKSNGVGLESVALMMKKMGGRSEVKKSINKFTIELWFPIIFSDE